MSKNRVGVPTCLQIVLRRCHGCASGHVRMNGTFPVHAHHTPRDARLLALCGRCGETIGLTAPELMNVRAARPQRLNLPHDHDQHHDSGRAAGLPRDPAARSRGVGGSDRTDRPAWQSPYGPPPRRAHRGRWAPVPGVATSLSALRRGSPCGRGD